MKQNVVALVGSNFAININFDLLSLSSTFFFSRKLTVYTMPTSLVKALVIRPN